MTAGGDAGMSGTAAGLAATSLRQSGSRSITKRSNAVAVPLLVTSILYSSV